MSAQPTPPSASGPTRAAAHGHTRSPIDAERTPGGLRLPDRRDVARYGRLAWVLAQLRGLTEQTCDTHQATATWYELHASAVLLDRFRHIALGANLASRHPGAGDGIRLPLDGSDTDGRSVFVSFMRAQRGSFESREDMYLLWPMVRGCPADCPNLPQRGILGLAPSDDLDGLNVDTLLLRYTLQVVDGMASADAKAAAERLSC